jgi:hypothetical protein
LPLIYKPITAITRSAPVSLTVPSHGLASGWSVAVTNAGGMTEINATANKLRPSDFYPMTVVDSDTITINAIDSSGFKPYTSGGHVVFYTPISLAGAKARLDLRDKVGGTLLYQMSDTIGNIILDDATHAIGLTIPAADSALFDFSTAVGDLEVEYSDGSVEELLRIEAELQREITTSA